MNLATVISMIIASGASNFAHFHQQEAWILLACQIVFWVGIVTAIGSVFYSTKGDE